jgi:hypothetical protein
MDIGNQRDITAAFAQNSANFAHICGFANTLRRKAIDIRTGSSNAFYLLY